MKILDHLAQAAAVILLVELLVVLFVFLAVAGGLAFGLYWVRGKSDWAFDKTNSYLPLVTRYVHQGTDYTAKPFIVGGRFAETVKGTIRSLERQIRAARSGPSPGQEAPTSPAEPESIEPASLV